VPSLAEKQARKPAAAKIQAPWWGKGEAPHLRWPGVTIDIPSVWVPSRKRWESPNGAYYFDSQSAEFAEGFFPTFLEHHIGAWDGKPFDLLPYQQLLVVRPLFGWKRSKDGLRRFRKVFLAVPKGSGKSPFGAGLGIFGAFFDGEAGSEVYAVAADRKQAGIVFDSAKIMVQRNEHLAARCEVFRDSIKIIGSTESFQVLSSDASTKHGFRPHFIIFDEFHAQPNRDLSDTLSRGMGKRRQPVLVMITTAGDDDESICFEEWDYARRVISGSVDDESHLPVIFEARADEDWTDEAVQRRVNPGYGITMQADYFISETAAAKSEPRKRNSFIQLHLNRWVNQATAWIPVEWWDASAEPVAPDLALAQLPVAAGLDMAQKIDLACLTLCFRHPIAQAINVDVKTDDAMGQVVSRTQALNYRITVLPFFWVPEDTMRERELADGVPYADWARQGLVMPTPGTIIDHERIFSDITTKILPRFPRLRQSSIGYDPAFATELSSSLNRFLPKEPKWCQEVLQNYKYMSEPCYVLEALIKSRRVAHGGHRILRNHIENVAVKTDDAGRIRPVKPKRSGKHIDGVVSTLMALRMLAAVPDQQAGPQMFIFGGRR
jgi:phage terminase large subunit-like protein